MESKRQQKYSKLIQKELGEIFQKEGKHLIGSAFITVARVMVSQDLSLARVYLSFLMDKDKAVFDTLNKKKSELRKHLGNRIGKSVRVVPEIALFLDESASYAQHMDAVISKLDIPEASEDDEDEEED
ncbi:Ribosome-binding factor A [Indibacter alkaliphilus LW1]|jgi:ribosome-binding factor A|uniref:Ribosome-binding factor A n=1 Tax=Indibacter alkaliphilus (strain CCUG 57479 / KCTC 22604 / LW1) TaxID=1189612 RepID=S2DBJ2_INDAL|nr:30S ribosome-binding factor RbfA [Indibacter alkaliphilus]EOZ96542.1 Ribosome-binding factor A [Indibacter alkaliphilus LW1]